MAYDMLKSHDVWLLDNTLADRRRHLEAFFGAQSSARLQLSSRLSVTDYASFLSCQEASLYNQHAPVEGLMIKRLDSQYVSGRPRGAWWKCKRDPYYLDCVLVYAQRGHGKRSSLFLISRLQCGMKIILCRLAKRIRVYGRRVGSATKVGASEYSGPVWANDPVATCVGGGSCFDRVMISPRRKAGYSLRFPRIHRIRWDKPVREADTLAQVRMLATPPTLG